MTMTDDRHEYDPSTCPGCAGYADKYGHSDLAANLNTEQANLDAARFQNSLARPAADPAADVAHPAMHDDTARRPRETVTSAAVGRQHIHGRRWPLTSTRARPSDFPDDEENYS
jgi:hypothetical protein